LAVTRKFVIFGEEEPAIRERGLHRERGDSAGVGRGRRAAAA